MSKTNKTPGERINATAFVSLLVCLCGETRSNWQPKGVKLRSNFLQPRSSAPKRVGICTKKGHRASLLCVTAAAATHRPAAKFSQLI